MCPVEGALCRAFTEDTATRILHNKTRYLRDARRVPRIITH